MRVLRVIVGGVVGAIPGILLIPVIEFYAMVVIVGGVVAGAMVGAAPPGRVWPTTAGAILGLVLGSGLGLLAGHLALIVAPALAFYGARSGMRAPASGGSVGSQPHP